ncbi:MAG: hypothetical protein H6540_03690 [Bacteroidales bacterium]|nr:hypothetical protein [Bacteroidales bacterium]
MKLITVTSTLLLFGAVLIAPKLAAQDNKKEIHIKIVENGVVTKDTVYTSNTDPEEFEHAAMMEKHMEHMDKEMDGKHVFVFKEGDDKDINWVSEDGEDKNVEVIVHSGDGPGGREVEEIWTGKQDEGKPCRTIIIHEGDCPGMDMEKDVKVFRGVGPEGMEHRMEFHGDGDQVWIEKNVTRSDDGKKVTVTETIESKDSGKDMKTNSNKESEKTNTGKTKGKK